MFGEQPLNAGDVLARVIELETQTNNRVSALQSTVSALQSNLTQAQTEVRARRSPLPVPRFPKPPKPPGSHTGLTFAWDLAPLPTHEGASAILSLTVWCDGRGGEWVSG